MAAANPPETLCGNAMAAVYYKSRVEAGERALEAFRQFAAEPLTVVSLSTDALVIGAELANALQCPLQLYLTADIDVPGGVRVGGVNQEGGFSYSSNMSSGESDYFYQEFRGYIEDAKRTAFSSMNRELQGQTVIRKDLLKGRSIIVVDDCMTTTVALDSFIDSLKPITYNKLYVCTPIISTQLVSHAQQVSDYVYFAGTVDFFYGKDHYFEDNTMYDRTTGIQVVSQFLNLWPAAA